MRMISFTQKAFQEYQQWVETDKKIALKIGELIRDIVRDPFNGLGKPEPLKNEFKGFWSRRITEEHRLVYKISNESILIISCYSHYK